NPGQWDALIAEASSMGRVWGLVNNAGVLLSAALGETSFEDWDRVVRVNQTGAFLGMRAIAPVLAEAGGGSIVNISSIAGLRSAPRNFAYGATKWALRGMSRA